MKTEPVLPTEFGSFTNADGLNLHTVKWLPKDDIRAVVVLVHGIGEHSGRYGHVAHRFNKHGYAVYALDHRGHGRSEGLRLHFDNFDQPVSDLEQFVTQVRTDLPNQPVYMYGHSMGAIISLCYVLQHQAALAGWISSGTPLLLDKATATPIVVGASFMARLLPKLRILPLDVTTLSRDPEVVAAYQADPYVNHKRIRLQIANAMVKASQGARTQLHTIQLPALILHGADDMAAPVAGSPYLYEHISSQDKTLKLYEGLYHEIHNEPEQERVLNDVVGWLDRQQGNA